MITGIHCKRSYLKLLGCFLLEFLHSVLLSRGWHNWSQGRGVTWRTRWPLWISSCPHLDTQGLHGPLIAHIILNWYKRLNMVHPVTRGAAWLLSSVFTPALPTHTWYSPPSVWLLAFIQSQLLWLPLITLIFPLSFYFMPQESDYIVKFLPLS